MQKQIINHTQVSARSHRCIVTRASENDYIVKSLDSGKSYIVGKDARQRDGHSCDCDWGLSKPISDQRSMCSHVTAVVRHVAVSNDLDIEVMSSEEALWYPNAKYYGDGTYVVFRAKESFSDFLNTLDNEADFPTEPPVWADEDYEGDDLLFAPPCDGGSMRSTTARSW